MSRPDEGAAAPREAPERDNEPPLPDKTRLQVARDVVVFQAKLFIDGLRDVLLSPISIVLGVVGLFVSRQPGEPFYRLLRAGKATESWIDLFGDAYPEDVQHGRQRRAGSLRELEHHLRALERNLATEDYDQGARESVARIRSTLNGLRRRPQEDSGDSHDAADGSR